MPARTYNAPPVDPAGERIARVLRELGTSPHAYATAMGIPHQALSQWMTGARWAPRSFVRAVWIHTGGRLGLADWPKVRDWITMERWRYGRLVVEGRYRSAIPEVAGRGRPVNIRRVLESAGQRRAQGAAGRAGSDNRVRGRPPTRTAAGNS